MSNGLDDEPDESKTWGQWIAAWLTTFAVLLLLLAFAGVGLFFLYRNWGNLRLGPEIVPVIEQRDDAKDSK